MNYGPHTDLVQEIIDFAEGVGVLQPVRPIEGERLHIIQDFGEAKEYAYHRYITDQEDAANWTDLREWQVGHVLGATYANTNLVPVRDSVRGLTDRLFRATNANLPAVYLEVVDDVAADLENCALGIAVYGPGESFFDLLWSVYRQGGWPCGWEGNYPEGRLVVFEPSLRS